jgi:hypothetical protein
MPGRCRWLSRITNGRGADHCSRMDLGVSATKIVVSVLSLPKVGFGPPIVGHYSSAFGLAYLISYVHLIALLLVVCRVFKKWPLPSISTAISYSPDQLRSALLYNSGQHFIRLLPLLRRTMTIKSGFPPILSFFNRYLPVLAAVKSPTAIVVTEFLPTGIRDKLFLTFSASDCHADIPRHSHLTNPIP